VRRGEEAVNLKKPISSVHWPFTQSPVTSNQYHYCSHNNSAAMIHYIDIILSIQTNHCSFFTSMNSLCVLICSLLIISASWDPAVHYQIKLQTNIGNWTRVRACVCVCVCARVCACVCACACVLAVLSFFPDKNKFFSVNFDGKHNLKDSRN